jgi:coproporphyrinogen III oxidase
MREPLVDRASAWFRALQDRICAALEALDGRARFREDRWARDGGGGGVTRVLEEGDLFEKAGVNWSDVQGELPGGLPFRATGVSLVLHPRSPMVPTVHANFRCLDKGGARGFGGVADLTPTYPWREDVVHFHHTFRQVCDRYDPACYPRFKQACDAYFFLPHRGETRGVGGIFFDEVGGDAAELERAFAFVRDAGDAILAAYLPIAERRRGEPWGEREREFQLWRRGRYVEFNLLYDRGTAFGLETRGRTESILMSLPPLVRWVYDHQPASGSREAELREWLKPTEWLG